MAEQVQYIITAVDRTRAAFAQIQGSFTKLQAGAASVQSAFAGLAAIGALGGIGASLRASIQSLDDFNDAADKTGASVESLSSILNTLGSTGATLEQVTDIASKLTRAMAGADEESSKAGEAFKLLGVATKDVAGNLRPVDDVLNDVAQALNRYQDGSNKTALAQALFGKSGAELLPILKDLATEQRRGATVTTEQAEQAERAQKALNRLTFEMQTMRNELASALIPGLTEFLSKLRSIAAISGNPIKWAEYLFGGASDINAEVNRIESEIKRLESVVTRPREEVGGRGQPTARADALEKEKSRKRLLDLQRDLQEAKAVQRTQRELGVSTAQPPRTGRALLFDATGYGPGADKDVAPRIKDAAKATKEQQSEAQRLLETLTQQLDKTRELSTEQEVLARIGRGEIAGLTPALEQQILLRAVQIDRLKQEAEARKELQKAIEEMAADEAKERDALQAARAPVSARVIEEAARILKELPQARQRFAAELTKYFDDRFFDDLIPEAEWKAAIDRINGLTREIDKTTKDTNDVARDLGLTFQSAFEDAIIEGQKLSSVLQSLGKDILRVFVRKSVTEPLLESLFGKDSKGGGLLSGFVQSIFGGARATGGPVGAGTAYLVGERGPELFVPGASGAIVPNNALGRSVAITQNITYGGNDRAGALALAASVKADTLRAMREAQARGAMA